MTIRVPLTLFYSYAHEDETLRNQLEKHLRQLQRQELISGWHDRKILPGETFADAIDTHLQTASIILLLISPDFLASDYCYDTEMQHALERHRQGEAHIILVILRPCDWQHPPLKDLQYLPLGGLPVTKWDNQDAAFLDITKGLRHIIEEDFGVTGTPSHVSPQAELPPLPTHTLLSMTSSVEQQNRERLIRRVRDFWIKSVLEQSLHNAVLITLRLQESPDAVANPWRLVLQESEYAGTPLPAGTRITDVYDGAEGELLILGEPGAGKTTLLLELARDLLKRAEQVQTHPIPVIFSLSSWTRKRQPLATWFIEELETKYWVPKKVGSDWINANQILPLLDGLDEVDATSRTTCMQAIDEYQQTHRLIPFVVCCRVNEYMSQANRLALYRAVTIQPLAIKQINEYFAHIGEQIASLRLAFQNDPVLQELATTPLMLTILILAYQGSSLAEIRGDVSVEIRQRQIFSTYTQRMLRRRNARSHYAPQQTILWLSYLSLRMKQQSQTVFYIERMQPFWLMKKWQRQLYYGLIVGPICGLLVGLDSLGSPIFPVAVLVTTLIFGLLFGWSSEPEAEEKGIKIITRIWMRIRHSLATALESRMVIGVVAGLATGIGSTLYDYLARYPNGSLGSRIAFVLSAGLFNGIYVGLSLGLAIKLDRRIEPMEALSWSWTGIQRNVVRWLLIGIGSSLILGLAGVLPTMISSQDLGLATLLIDGLLATCYFILFTTLISGVTRGLSKRVLDAQDIVTPNQGTWRSARYGVVMAIISGVIAAGFIGASDFIAYFWLPLHMGSFPAEPLVTDYSFALMVSHLLGFYPNTLQEYWTLNALYIGLKDGATMGVAVGLYCGGAAYVQHFVLRFLLWGARRIPFNYPHFLDYAAERVLLRKVGGGYIFIHRLLMEYFASLEEKPNPHKSGI